MPLGILIDLDDTLIDDTFAMRQAARSFGELHEDLAALATDRLADRWGELTETHWRRFRDGKTTLQGQRRARVRGLLSRDVPDPEADALFARYLERYETHWRLVEGADEFLARTAGVPKVIVSNGERGQALRKVERLGMGRHFVAVLTPEDTGKPKPDPSIFLAALALLGLEPADCLMIGDNLEADIVPARSLGMAAFHVSMHEPGRRLVDSLAGPEGPR